MNNYVVICSIPNGDNLERRVCTGCGHVAHENPKVVVGAVVVSENRIVIVPALLSRAKASGRFRPAIWNSAKR